MFVMNVNQIFMNTRLYRRSAEERETRFRVDDIHFPVDVQYVFSKTIS